MTSDECKETMRIVESKLKDFSAPVTIKVSPDHALESCGTNSEGETQAVHRLMRVVSSLKSLTPEVFQPVRCLPW